MTSPSTTGDQRELLDIAERVIPGGCLGMMALPADLRMVMVRGQGSKVYDAAGKEYLDYMLGSGPLLVGHCRPEVVEAVQHEAARGSAYFALNEPAIRLAETIVDAVPCAEALRFQTTGSEATFAAVRLARAYTGRHKVLKFEGGWHGGHDLGQLSGAPADPPPFPEAAPDCDGIPHSVQHDALVAPFNDWETTATIIERHHRDLAAVIVEPLQRVLVPVAGFLQGLRSITRKLGIVLIFDEIVTGFRLAWGGAQEQYGVVPELACYAYQIEYRFKDRKTGGYRWFLGRAVPVRDEQGKVVRWFGTCTDIDDTKRTEEALKEADRRKDEFLAMLAHELRNPLAPIRNALHVVQMRGRERRLAVRQAWETIERQVENLVRLVDDLLDVSRTSRGKINLRKEAVEVATLVARSGYACRR